MAHRRVHRLGVISDTHGLLRPEAMDALAGVERVLHAGDIGNYEVVSGLRAVAEVDAVRGNVDHGPWAAAFPEHRVVEIGGARILLLHRLADLPVALGSVDAVVCGHSHVPQVRRVDRTLLFNPGSAGPRRFSLPVSVGLLTVTDGWVDGEIVGL